MSRAELEAAIESEDGHVHGPGCGHDHGEKPAKKAAAKKAAGQGRGRRGEAGEEGQSRGRSGTRRQAREKGGGEEAGCQKGVTTSVRADGQVAEPPGLAENVRGTVRLAIVEALSYF